MQVILLKKLTEFGESSKSLDRKDFLSFEFLVLNASFASLLHHTFLDKYLWRVEILVFLDTILCLIDK